MNKFLSFCLLCSMAAVSYAAGDWSGKVLDENGEPLPYANVAVLGSTDSTLIGGTISGNDGTFSIAAETSDAILMVSMMGYKTQYLTPGEEQTITLVPDNTLLGEVVVGAAIPKITATSEGLKTSVQGSVLENLGTANDVLEKTPGMIKGQNGVEVIGKGSPLVYINGRRMTDATELDRLQSNEIQSIEVITNPGAQYDASVRSVVRIRTIRRQGDGFSLNAYAEDHQSLRRTYLNDPKGNLDINYRIGDIDIFAGASLSRYSSRQESDIFSESFGTPDFSNDGWVTNEFVQKSANTNAGMDWQIAENHSVGFKFQYGWNFYMSQYEELYEAMRRNGLPYDETFTYGDYFNGEKAPKQESSNMYYNGTAGKLGIDFNFDWFRMYDSNLADITESSSMIGSDISIGTQSETDNNLYAAKLILSYPVWRGQLQIGTEETFSRRSDEYNITGAPIPASSSKVREDNSAAFASYAFALFTGQFTAGVRYEHVNYGYDDLSGGEDIVRKYDNVYPTVSYAGAFGPVTMMLSYSEKTQRPDFSQLSSAIRYNSKYIIQSGNAALQPMTIRDASLMANWQWMTFMAEYTRTDNDITSWSYRFDDEGVMLVRPRNLDTPLHGLTAFINVTPTIGIWTMNYTAGIQQQWLTVNAPDPREPSGMRTRSFNDRPLCFVQMFNTFSLNHDWQIECGAEFHSKGYVQNFLIDNVFFDVTAAIQKSLLKDKSLVIRLEGNDLAGLAYNNVYTDYGGTALSQSNIMDTQRITLSLRYRFNAASSKYRGTGAGQDVISRMK